jgi:hypothetical protein
MKRSPERRGRRNPVGDPKGIRGVGRLPGAGGVPGDDREPVGEALELWPPRARVVGEPVQQDQRRTVTGPLVGDR